MTVIQGWGTSPWGGGLTIEAGLGEWGDRDPVPNNVTAEMAVLINGNPHHLTQYDQRRPHNEQRRY